MKRVWMIGLVAAALAAGCGGGDDATGGRAEQPSATAGDPAPAEPVSVGTVAFSVDGVSKQYDNLPGPANTYTPLASTVTAMPSEATGEQLTITFLSIDLKQPTYPASLPPTRAQGETVDPMAAMALVGFSYTDVTGREWAGPGRIEIESFGNNGVIQGRFSDVSLPHTDKQAPDITLSAGQFSARISSPW